MSNTKLPLGWIKTHLGNVLLDIVGGGTPSRRIPEYYQGNIPWFTVKDMKTLKPSDSEEHISDVAVAQSAAQVIPANTLIVATRIGLGKAIRPTVPCAINQDLKALIVGSGMDSDFLLYWIMANEKVIQGLGSGTTVSGIRLDTLRKLPLQLPPSAEQARIAEKLEELMSDLDSAEQALKSASQKIPQYRHSLLLSAISGELTATWRNQNGPSESGIQLLERILAQRRARWQKMQEAVYGTGDAKSSYKLNKKYSEPDEPETAQIPNLPTGWAWATLSQIGWLDRGRSRHRPRNSPHLYGGPYPFVQTGDIRQADTFISKVETTYSEAGLEQSRIWPSGTLCITIAANIGKTAILSMDACFPDSVVGFLPGADEVSVRYVEYFMRAIQPKLEDEAPATAQKNINLSILNKLSLPVPPIAEQNLIVDTLDEHFATALNQEKAIEFSLRQSAAQRKNILKSAFEGTLLAQDPNDENASLLLQKIGNEQIAYQKKILALRRDKETAVVDRDIKELLRTWILQQDKDEFSFDEISKSVLIEYDALKDAMFDLLGEANAPIVQHFSKSTQSMKFKRVNA